MSNLLINEPPLQLLPSLAKAIGLNEAIILQQLHYWSMNKRIGKIDDNGRKWVRNSIDQWHEDNFPFWSADTIRRVLSKLEAANLITSGNLNNSAYDRTLWYSINYDILATCQAPFMQVAEMDNSKLRKFPERKATDYTENKRETKQTQTKEIILR